MANPVDKPDYYSILNVTKEATRDQVRTSYKLLAMVYILYYFPLKNQANAS